MTVFIEKSENALLRFAADSRAEMIQFATQHGVNALDHYKPEGYFELIDGALKRQFVADPLIHKLSPMEFCLRLKTVSA